MVGCHSSVMGDPNEVDTVLQMVTNIHRLIHNNTRTWHNPSPRDRASSDPVAKQPTPTNDYKPPLPPLLLFLPIIYNFALAFSSSID